MQAHAYLTRLLQSNNCRFPRVEAIRYDKQWFSCLTQRELQDTYESPARRDALEAMLETQGRPLLTKRQRKTQQTQSQSQLLFKTEESTVGGEGLAPLPRAHRRPPLPVRVVDTYRTIDPGLVERKDDLLHGLELCVMGDFDLAVVSSDDEAAYSSSGGDGGSGSDTSHKTAVASVSSVGDHRILSKTDVEKLVVEHGGRLTSSPRLGETALVVAPDAKSFRVKLLIRAGEFDVVSLSYLLRVIREGKLTPPRFLEYLFITKETRERLSRVVDEYGDAYTEPTTTRALARCMRHIKEPLVAAAAPAPSSVSRPRKGSPPPSTPAPWQGVAGRAPWRSVALASLRQKADHQLLLEEGTPFNFLYTFGQHVFYLDRFQDLGPLQIPSTADASPPTGSSPLPITRLDHLAYAIPLHGGVLSEALHAGVTHVVVDPEDRRRFPLLAARLKALRRLPVAQFEIRIVRLEWVEECLKAKRVVPVEKRHLVALR